jgi:tetratricopeptide (TPR) repeat protein
MTGSRNSAVRRWQTGVILLGLLVFSVCPPRLPGQSSPAAASAEPQPKAMLVDGQPALSLDYGDGMGFLIVYTKFHDKPAFRFSVSHGGFGVVHTSECGGYLWIAKDEIAYFPDATANEKVCTHMRSSMTEEFDLPRNQFTTVHWSTDAAFLGLSVREKAPNVSSDGFYYAFFVHNIEPRDNWWIGDHRDTAQLAESNSAGKTAMPWLQGAFDNFPDAEMKFQQATSTITLPSTASQENLANSAVKAGTTAEQNGNLQAAFNTYVSALANLPPNATGEQVDSLRDHMLRLVARLSPAPAVPEEAKRHLAFALAAMSDWKSSGDAGKLSEAVDELNQVARLAPWRPEVYFNLGAVLEGQNQYAAAARDYKLYLLAAPDAPDASAVQQKIYQLEYKTGAR